MSLFSWGDVKLFSVVVGRRGVFVGRRGSSRGGLGCEGFRLFF